MEEDYTIANKQGNDYTIVYIFFTQKKQLNLLCSTSALFLSMWD